MRISARARHRAWGWRAMLGAPSASVLGMRRIAAAVLITASPSHAYATETLHGVFTRLLRGL